MPSGLSLPRRPALPRWVGLLGRSGVPEALAAIIALAYDEAFPITDRTHTVQAAILNVATLVFAGMTGRFPRVGTFGVMAGLSVLALTGGEGFSLGTIVAMFIPIVANGAHGRASLRDLAAVSSLFLMCAVTIPMSQGPQEVVETIVLWTLFILIALMAGRTIHRLRRDSEQQVERRAEALRSQRRGIARDLHDTVAYSATTMVMRAEEMKLRTDDPQMLSDLDFIITTGRRSVRDLRGMMETLRRNDPALDATVSTAWRVTSVNEVIDERVVELAHHGVRLHTHVDDNLDELPDSVRETLAKLVVEATSNMVKHAGPGACQLMIEVGEESVEAVFTNPLKPGGSPTSPDGGLGIMGAAERVQAVGGELEASEANGTWILRVQLPIGR